MTKEKRIYRRHIFKFEVFIEYDSISLNALLNNISLGGANLMTTQEIPEDLEKVMFVIEQENDFFYEIESIVTWREVIENNDQKVYRYGIEFKGDIIKSAEMVEVLLKLSF